MCWIASLGIFWSTSGMNKKCHSATLWHFDYYIQMLEFAIASAAALAALGLG